MRASVDLPQPDSPTRPSVRPGYSERLTLSTALTLAGRGSKKPLRTENSRLTCTSSSNASIDDLQYHEKKKNFRFGQISYLRLPRAASG